MNEKYKLLLIDDEAQFRFMTRMGLESNGFTVLEAADGNEGLEILAKEKPDLVLLDLNMPDPDGRMVCDIIKNDESLKEIPVIILTTSDDLSDKVSQLEGGADDYITKSVDPKERAARIRAVIRRNLQNLDSNPLTHLPGNNKIQEIIIKRMESKDLFAAANNLRHTFTNIGEIVKIVTELKKYAKQKKGSFLAIDKRG